MVSKQSLRAQVPTSTITRHNLAKLVVSFVDEVAGVTEAMDTKKSL